MPVSSASLQGARDGVGASFLAIDHACRRVEVLCGHLLHAPPSLSIVPHESSPSYAKWLRALSASPSAGILREWLDALDRFRTRHGPAMNRIRIIARHLQAAPHIVDLL